MKDKNKNKEKDPPSEEQKELRTKAESAYFSFASAHEKFKKIEQYCELLLERLAEVLLT